MKTGRYVITWLSAGALALGAVMTAQATSIIVDPESAAANQFNSSTYAAANTYNGSGLSANLLTGDLVPPTWPMEDTVYGHAWVSSLALPAITWNLGASYELAGFHLWNYNETDTGSNRGFKTVDIYTSINDINFTFLQSMPLAAAPHDPGYRGDQYWFITPVTAQWVEFVPTSTYDNDGFVGLSEIRFETVPEPGVALLLGIGAALLWFRRQQR